MSENPYILLNHRKNSVVFTGTHDNNTTLGWYQSSSKTERKDLYAYLSTKPSVRTITSKMHQLAMMSVSDLAIIPMQDLLGLDESAKMNTPGTSEGNWRLLAPQLRLERVEEPKQVIFAMEDGRKK